MVLGGDAGWWCWLISLEVFFMASPDGLADLEVIVVLVARRVLFREYKELLALASVFSSLKAASRLADISFLICFN